MPARPRTDRERFALCYSACSQVVLLELGHKVVFPNAEHARAESLSPPVSPQGAEKSRGRFNSLERQRSHLIRRAFRGGILQVGGQISNMEDRAGTQRDGSLDGVFQLRHVSGQS